MKKIFFTTKAENGLKIHFLGIGGSGVAAVAELASQSGYEVSGCDVNEETAYSDKLKKFGIKTHVGHSQDHLKNIDLLVVTPAIFFMNQDNSEVVEAKKTIPVISWQEFLGKYLQKGKKVICVAGTHGKSTTTALLSIVLEEAGLDPLAVVGATVKEWGSNSRYGEGEYFVTEADEFNNNFLFYHPEILIINNIEFDHPDFFKSEEQVLGSFKKLVENMVGQKILIVNKDDTGVNKLLELIDDNIKQSLKIIEYSLRDVEINQETEITAFKVAGKEYKLKIPGNHNVANALGIIAVAKHLGISKEKIDKAFVKFEGIGRRLELIGEKNNIKVYDDYAHHPTAIKATIEALRQKYPDQKIWVVVEAHGFARTKALLNQYEGAFDKSDRVIIGPIFKARDAGNFGVDEKSIVEASKHKDISYFDSFDEVLNKLKKEVEKGNVVLVMGAGESYKWAKQIFGSL